LNLLELSPNAGVFRLGDARGITVVLWLLGTIVSVYQLMFGGTKKLKGWAPIQSKANAKCFQVLSLCSESHCLCCRHCKCCQEAAHSHINSVRRYSSVIATTSYDGATLHGRSVIGSSESLIGSNFLQPYQQQQQLQMQQQQQQQQQTRTLLGIFMAF